MIGVLRLFILVLLVQTAVFLLMSWAQRNAAERRARAEWEALPGRRIDWDTYYEREMREYERSIRRRLIWAVYVLPLTVIALLVYFVNFA